MRTWVWMVVVVGLVAGCAEGESDPADRAPVSGEGVLYQHLTAAAAEFAVPVELLAAAAWSESRLVAQDSAVGRRGLFQLDAAALARGAALIGVDPEVAATDETQHIRAFAALVAAGGPDQAAALAATRGDAAGGEAFVEGVELALERGFDATTVEGHLHLAPGGLGVLRQAARPDTPLARWVASPNFSNSNRARGAVDAVIIHVTQGSYAGAISWFQNPESQVSSHYVIRSSDGQITQMVEEEDTAWHARSWNSHSIGIEHEGFIADPQWFTEEMYRSSATLTREICQRWGIPMDRQHILGHVELSGNDHTDPGPHWNWDHYMDLVRGEDTPQPPCAVVGAQGGTLDDTGPCFQASGPAQYWRHEAGMGEGGSLIWTNAFQAAEPSNWGRWRLFLEAAGEYDVAISTGDFGVCTQTPYRIRHNGEVSLVSLDQSAGNWLPLGRFEFAAGGDQYIDVLDNLPGAIASDQHIVADAVRLTPVGSPVMADAGLPDPGDGPDAGADAGETPRDGAVVDARTPVDPQDPDPQDPDPQDPETPENPGCKGDCADAGDTPNALQGDGGCGVAPTGDTPLALLVGAAALITRRRRRA